MRSQFAHMLHNEGRILEAKGCYALIVAETPSFTTGWYDLGVAFQAEVCALASPCSHSQQLPSSSTDKDCVGLWTYRLPGGSNECDSSVQDWHWPEAFAVPSKKICCDVAVEWPV
jgi:hypothetical protein